MPASATSVDVFSSREIARVAGVSAADVRALIAAGRLRTVDGRFVDSASAVDAVRQLRSEIAAPPVPDLFEAPDTASRRRQPGGPFAASALAHALMLGGFALLMTLGATAPARVAAIDTTRLVFLALPGPGGGGGGGGLKQPKPTQRAELKGSMKMRSPVSTAKVIEGPKTESKPDPPVLPEPAPKPVEPPPPEQKPDPAPPVVAPVATVAADATDKTGVVDSTSSSNSQGQGTGGGAGVGNGRGMGEGNGAGIGPGSTAGIGGGPYRPGNGIAPPSLLREVKPDYTEEARRRNINGDVELEIVVRSDGSVGDIRLLRGLGAGLDQRAIDAVRQWRFSPARRFGTPVDVLVEVAVEFRVR